MRSRSLLLLACCACIAPAWADEDARDAMKIDIVSPVRDEVFGVATRHAGLQRKVEMFQWRKLGPGYAKIWSDKRIDSASYASSYQNPAAFPWQTQEWIADVRIDGKPIEHALIEQLGQWHSLRPGFSALSSRLAENLQPEGDGLGSALNPLEPAIGDVRISWRELRLPPLQGRIALQSGHWVAAPMSYAAVDASAGSAAAADPPSRFAWLHVRWWFAILLLPMAWWWLRRRGR